MINAQYYFQIIYNLVFTLKRNNQLKQETKNDLEEIIREFLYKYPTRKNGLSANHSNIHVLILNIARLLSIYLNSNYLQQRLEPFIDNFKDVIQPDLKD